MEEVIDQPEKPEARLKINTVNAICVGAFLGGPLTAGYLIAENFKALDQRRNVSTTWMIAIAATIIIFGLILFVPQVDELPRYLIPIVYSAITYLVVMQTQGDAIKKYITDTGGMQTFTAGRTIIVSIIGCVVTLVPIVIYVLLNDPTITAASKSYGQLNHEIYYDGSVKESEADQIAQSLTKAGFFGEEQQVGIFLRKREGQFIISAPLIRDAWNDEEVIKYYSYLRQEAQKDFQEKIVIELCSEQDITDVKRTLAGS